VCISEITSRNIRTMTEANLDPIRPEATAETEQDDIIDIKVDSSEKQDKRKSEKEINLDKIFEERINPFSYHDKLRIWEVPKYAIGIVLLPVKFGIFIILLLSVWFFCKLSISFGYDETKPMNGCRRLFLKPVRLLQRLVMFVFGYYWIPIIGKPAKRSEAMVFTVASHSTFLDPWVLGWAIGMYGGLGKEEAKKTPIFGTIFMASQAIAVQRESSGGRKAALTEFVRRAQTVEEKWPQLLVFPEGTCTNRKALIQFKKGAFAPGMPVQPVLLRWPHFMFDPTWTSSGPNRIVLILRLLCQVYNRCSVEFLPVYQPSDEEIKDPILYAENVRKLMASKLNVGTTEHSYEDTFLSMAAKKSKFNPDHILDFEFAQLRDLSFIDLKEAKRMLRQFGMDEKVKKTGRMNVTQFAKAMKVPLTEPMMELFSLIDTDDDGTIDFKAFLVGITFMSRKTSVEDGCEFLFQALDADNTGKIDIDSLTSIFKKVFRKADRKSAERIMRAADPKGTGYVDKDAFVAFIKKNPEYLLIGRKINDAFKEQGRPLSVMKDQKEASARMMEKKVSVRVEDGQ